MRGLIIIVIIVITGIIGISIYLQPNDLRGCDDTPNSTTCSAVDAIVAVSGGDTNARTDEAIALYKNGWSDVLVFSGAAQDKSGISNAAAMKQRALAAGIDASHIYIEELSENTRENAENSQSIFAEKGVKSVILVTSGYHQKRASLEFNQHTHNVTIYNHPVDNDQDWSLWWWTNPRGWSLAVTELVKIGVFHAGASK